MQAYIVDRRLALKFGVPGLSPVEASELLDRRLVLPTGTPVVLDGLMRPVEPICSWLRHLGLAERDPKTMRAYVGSILRLQDFLDQRGSDLLAVTEADVMEFRLWRKTRQDGPIQDATWEKESAAIVSFYDYLVSRGHLERRPWRHGGRRDTLRSGTNRDPRIRHLTLDQYRCFRDVGMAGFEPGGEIDFRFRGWHPHRNRAATDLALVTGMRLQEWSTLLLPELGIGAEVPRGSVEFDLGVCAKYRRPRTVYVTADAMNGIDNYIHLERREIVATAQRTLKARRSELFVVDRITDAGRLHGRLDGLRAVWAITAMEPELRAITALDTGCGLEPLALFVGRGGAMLTPSGWDRVRWRAWERMKAQPSGRADVELPRRPWLYHDMRHTFALQLLIYLTRKALADEADQTLPMASLVDHMVTNPILNVQMRLGHSSPATTYKYVRYLRDPMRDVEETFRRWSQSDAPYFEIAADAFGPTVADAKTR